MDMQYTQVHYTSQNVTRMFILSENIICLIFALSCRYNACPCVHSDSDTSMKARVSLLAEARHTAYVKGRWIKGHSEWEETYRIVQPILPGNGDYNLCSIMGLN